MTGTTTTPSIICACCMASVTTSFTTQGAYDKSPYPEELCKVKALTRGSESGGRVGSRSANSVETLPGGVCGFNMYNLIHRFHSFFPFCPRIGWRRRPTACASLTWRMRETTFAIRPTTKRVENLESAEISQVGCKCGLARLALVATTNPVPWNHMPQPLKSIPKVSSP